MPTPDAEARYDVLRVLFSQKTGIDHDTIILVDGKPSGKGQGTGILVHVRGDVGLGMDYQVNKRYDFLSDPSYKSQEQVGSLSKSKLNDFLAIAQAINPPHDPEVMFGKKTPAENCTSWVNKLLQKTENLRST